MKHVDDLQAEPASLAYFRGNNPGATFKDFKDYQGGDAYRELLAALISNQGVLCAYCEIDLTNVDRQVEHFHPQSDTDPDHDWGLDCRNMLACCKGGSCAFIAGRFREPARENLSCSAKKGDAILDGIILHPRDVPRMPSIFSVRPRSGELTPRPENCRDIGWDPDRVQRTIEELGLNCPRLRDSRTVVFEQLYKVIQGLTDPGADAGTVVEKWLSAHDGRLSPFFTTVRSFFGSAAENFLSQNYP